MLIFLKKYDIIIIENEKKRYKKLNPFNCLTEKDKNLIESYITWFGPNNARNMDWSCRADLEKVLSHWDKEKSQFLFKMFNNELILSRPYTYKYNVNGLCREISKAMSDKACNDFLTWWNWKIKHNNEAKFEIIYPNSNDASIQNYYYSKFYYIEKAFENITLAENSYSGSEFKVKFEDGTIFKVTTGMKPMKILHKFIEKFGKPEDEEMFERFRIWHSQLLNQKNVDGELCLSIHPLDYMTMSDNDSGWSSCMRWTDKYGNDGDPGDYRAGTVDCLNSPYIIVAYLHNKKHPFKLHNGNWEWNNKRWRELFIVNEGCINEIKGYPYQDENLTNACLMWIKELASKNLGWTYEDDEVNMIKRCEGLEKDSEFYFDFIKSPFMYKDIGSLDKHVGRINKKVLFEKYKEDKTTMIKNDVVSYFINIPYGGYPTCMCCGNKRYEDNNDKAVMCARCDSVTTCCYCGDPIYSDEDIYWVDDSDEPMCYNCWCDLTTLDDLSEESHLTDNMKEIWLLLGYTEDKEPIWYRDKTIWTYEPDDNWYYQDLFTEGLKRDQADYWGCTKYYVTLDMIRDGRYNEVMNVFDRPSLEDLYPEELYYHPDMTLINEDEKEN